MRPFTSSHIRWAFMLLVAIGILPVAGCQICCDPDALSYPTYGGAWERTRRDGGRVGSIFDPAGAKASTLVGRDEPSTPDVRDRKRYEEDPNAFSLEPDKKALESNDGTSSDDSGDQESLDDRIQRLKGEDLEDINIVPGEAAPPLLF